MGASLFLSFYRDRTTIRGSSYRRGVSRTARQIDRRPHQVRGPNPTARASRPSESFASTPLAPRSRVEASLPNRLRPRERGGNPVSNGRHPSAGRETRGSEMPGDNVRLAVYARLSDGLVLASHKGRATDAAKDTAKKVLESGNLKPNAQLTVTVTPEIGTLHLAAGDVDVVAVITATEYPRRAAFKLLDEIRGQVSEAAISAEDVAGATKEGALESLLPFLRDACLRYEDLAEVDKLTAVGAQVDEVKATMEGNINRMLDNAETVGAVEDKSEALRAGAQQFQRRSDNVRRMMWWRLVKLKIIFGTLVICILGYIIVPIISAANDDSK